MRDYAFYNASSNHGFRAWLLSPPRRLLRRLLRPIFFRQVELLAQLGAQLDQLDHRVGEMARQFEHLSRKLDALTQDQLALPRHRESVEALACDLTAVARRLGTIEDHLTRLCSTEQQSLQHLEREAELDREAEQHLLSFHVPSKCA